MSQLTLKYGITDYRYSKPKCYDNLKLPPCIMFNVNGSHLATVYALNTPNHVIQPDGSAPRAINWGYTEKFKHSNSILYALIVHGVNSSLDESVLHEIYHEILHRHTTYFKNLLGVKQIDWALSLDLCKAVPFDITMYEHIISQTNTIIRTCNA